MSELEVKARTVNQIIDWSMFRPKGGDTLSTWEKRKMTKWVTLEDAQEAIENALKKSKEMQNAKP